MTAPVARLVGQPVRRREDHRFLTGTGRFVDDLHPPGLLHAIVLRSPYAHAELVGLDVEAARAMPGVHLVLSAGDLAAVGLHEVPVDFPPPGRSFEDWAAPAQPILATARVRYVGDPVAFVVAGSSAEARDAAEAIAAEYRELPPRLDLRAGETIFEHHEGDGEAVAAAFAAAHRIVVLETHNNRIEAAPIETRGCIGEFGGGGFTLHVSTQRVQIIQRALADRVFRVPRDRMRVVAPDTGGGFGQKNGLYPEYVLCLEAARRLGRPVKWIADRTEAFAADGHGRDNRFEAEAALDAAGRIVAVRATRLMNMGAYASSRAMVPVANGLTHLTGIYPIPAAEVTVRGVLTNTATTCSYRGAGRPENVFCCERLVDTVARALGQDPIAYRRAHLLRPDEMPWTSPLGTRFERLDLAGLLDRAAEAIDHVGFPVRREASARQGRLRGLGACLFAEDLHGSMEPIPAVLAADGPRLTLTVGTGSSGQGHETSFLQILSDRLELPLESFGFMQSDTAAMPDGVGTAASWSLTLAGSSVAIAADAAIAEGRQVASRLLEVSADDVAFEAGRFRVPGTDLALGWAELLAAEPHFRVVGRFEGHGQNVPAGCHLCEVEVDPETGAVVLAAYAVAQDSGRIVNPLLVEGQLHGGVAQGVGQGWMEAIVYDPDTGQLLTGSFTDYALPRAADLPLIATRLSESPADDNPLGVKGVGEAATTGSAPAFVNAVLDALAPIGVAGLDPPLTPGRVWAAIARAGAQPARCPPER